MTDGLRADLDFLLHEWLQVGELSRRPRYAEHGRETCDALLDSCERIAAEAYAPANRAADADEPRVVDGRVQLPAGTAAALAAYRDSGLLAAPFDTADGGLQLPACVDVAAHAYFYRASVAIAAYPMLTRGNAALLLAHGTPRQRQVFARAEIEGRWFGTMCLSEPQAGSSLGDIATRALPDGAGFEADPLGPRYRLHGHKTWISGGDHELAENIVHLVLAKVPQPDGRLPPGTRGISLFVVPRHEVDADGRLTGVRNDVALAGLNHKLGYRGTSNALLNFGEAGRGALGWRVGAEGDGLRCMFHMMNEARIQVGLGAAMLGRAGYDASLDYARQRPQGRPIGARGKDATQPQVPIIEHADVKRMLLAQKSYVEGGLALVLYCARLVDEQRSGEPASAFEAGQLLELLTPIAKSWPSEWGLEANSLAIQVLGGCGYTRDFPVEQHWRDNRLNMIHEGTHGIQALDLLGRKVVADGGAALKLLAGRVSATLARAGQIAGLAEPANRVAGALQRLGAATKGAWATGVPDEALANATPYLQAFGHVVLAWLWLDIVLALGARSDDHAQGKRAAMRYFHDYELPKIEAWLGVVAARHPLPREMRDAWF